MSFEDQDVCSVEQAAMIAAFRDELDDVRDASSFEAQCQARTQVGAGPMICWLVSGVGIGATIAAALWVLG